MYQRKGYWFSLEERIAIVREFENRKVHSNVDFFV